MAETTEAATTARTVSNGEWKGGVVAGIAGSVVMAVLMLVMGANMVLAAAIPGLYTLAPPPNPAVGIFVHLSHGAVFGVVFAALATVVDLGDLARSVGAGIGYGVVVWVVAAALLMPLWLSAVGFPNAPPFPNFAVPSLLWHAVFGAVLGAVFPYVRDL